jgi:tRNA (mo5U34)-methyltransferase
VVLFAGVFYHFRHPLLMLESIARLAIEYLIGETHLDALDEQRPSMIFYPGNELADDPTSWWGPNAVCVEAMMRDVGCSEVEYTPHPTEANRGVFHGRK